MTIFDRRLNHWMASAILTLAGIAWQGQAQTSQGNPSVEIPTVTVLATDPRAAEEYEDPGGFTVYRSGPATTNELAVFFQVGGSASSGRDYTNLAGKVTIPAKKISAPIMVQPIDDKAAEPDETVMVTLTPNAAYKIGTPNTATLVIYDNDLPPTNIATITFTAPTNGAHFTAPTDITVAATAIDPHSYISAVDFYAGTNKIGRSELFFFAAPPPGTPIDHYITWKNVPAGNYTLSASAMDFRGQVIFSTPIQISVSISDNTPMPPTVSIRHPVEGAKFPYASNVLVSVQADSSNSWIKILAILEGQTKLAVLTNREPTKTFGMEYVWTNPPSGQHSLVAHAVDGLGNYSTSKVVNFKVEAPLASQLVINSPTNGTRFVAPANIAVRATAIDPHGYISTVDFYNGTTLIGHSTVTFIQAPVPGTPVQHLFEWKNVAAGNYSIFAKARTTSGAYVTSQPVNVVVANANFPMVKVEATTPLAYEDGLKAGVFTLFRSGNVETPLTIRLAISGTASNGVDYVRIPETIQLAARAVSTNLLITPIEDKLVENTEEVILQVLTGTNYGIIQSTNNVVRIIDNDKLTNFVIRTLPETYTPGIGFLVSLHAKPASNVTAYAVEELIPAGWTATNVSHEGIFDVLNHKVKFGPYFDHTERALSYQVKPPAGETGAKVFSGIASADGNSQVVGGTSEIRKNENLYHPADISSADFVMSVIEVTAYGSAWKKGSNWTNGPNPIPISYVSRAGSLWRNGENYHYDASAGQPPLCWVNNTAAKPQGLSKATMDDSLAQSIQPMQGVAGQTVTVQIVMQCNPAVTAYAAAEQLPPDWIVTRISEGGQLDIPNRTVKWFFLDGTPRNLSYEAMPANAGTCLLNGTASFNGVDQPVSGLRQITILPALAPLKAINRSVDGMLTVTFQGSEGQAYLVEVSTDLVTWDKVGVVNCQGEAFNYLDQDSAQHPRRFYRAQPVR